MTEPLIKISRFGATLQVIRYEKPLLPTPGGGILHKKHRTRTMNQYISPQKLEHNIRRTKRRIRQFVSAVAYVRGAPSFATFTYDSDQHDMQQAIADWKLFTRRMQKNFPDAGFVRVPERTKKGNVHFHAVIFGLPPNLPCVMKKRGKYWMHACSKERACERKLRALAAVWGHGFVDLNVVRSPQSVGAYVAKYLTKGKPDWTLFGHHVATCNRKMYEFVAEARAKGVLYELSSYSSPVAVSMTLDDMHDVAEIRSVSEFDTQWLGKARCRRYTIHSLPGEHSSALLEQGNV